MQLKIYEWADKSIWKMFSKYHYLSHLHNNASKVFIATFNDEIAGFMSVLHFVHPTVKNMKKAHRIVTLPDYQGVGIGKTMLNEIAKIYVEQGQRFTIVTSTPSLIYSLKNNSNWLLTHKGRKPNHRGELKKSNSFNRITTSWEYKK